MNFLLLVFFMIYLNVKYLYCGIQWLYSKNKSIRVVMDKPLDWELHFHRRYRCRNSIRPRNCERAFTYNITAVPLARCQILNATRRKFRRFPWDGSPAMISREESPHDRTATISMDLSSSVNSSFFFSFSCIRAIRD